MIKTDASQFFSVPNHLILTGKALPYDLYVNSSAREGADRFVKVFPMGENLDQRFLTALKKKYVQLYISEFHRQRYLKAIMANVPLEDLEKVDIIKDSAIHYLGTLFDDKKEFSTELISETINGCRDSVEHMVDTLTDYDLPGLKDLIGELSFHDFYTYDHSINVAMYCIAIHKALKPNSSKEELTQVGLGGLLHDLGKTKISTSIINKVGKLSDEEFEEIKAHPGVGLEMLGELDLDCPGVDFNTLGRVIHEHHENYNGTGYPQGLKEDQIHLHARICAVADFFDAITTKRSYADVLPMQEAINVMSRTVGKKIDPFIFKVFQQTMKTFVQKDNIKFELDESYDSERVYEKLPLKEVKTEEAAAKKSTKVNFMDHKDKPERPKEMPKRNGNANDFISGGKKKAG